MSAAAEMEVAQGTQDQLSFNVGGKKPTGSSLRIVGGRIEVNGQYEKGQILAVEMLVQVSEVSFADERDDKTQQIVGCERRHKARVVSPPTVSAAPAEG